MNARIAALMGSQNGLVLRRQALAAGLDARQVDRLAKVGEWVAVRRGVYCTGLLWDSLDPYVGRPRLRAIAASRNMIVPHVLSHDSAALLHGMPILLGDPELVHITRFGALGGRTRHGVKHHQAPYRPDQLVEIDGVWVLDRARTAVDIAREHGERHGLVACDSARRLGVPQADLDEAVAAMESWPYVVRTKWCVAHADDRPDSVLEALGRCLLIKLGIGEVQPQFGLTDGHRSVWCDLRVGRHVVECDGRLKYRRPEQGGVAADPDRALWEEKRRQDFITGFKLGMSRLTYADVMPDRWRATGERIHREHAETTRLFGSSIADLEQFVIRRPAV